MSKELHTAIRITKEAKNTTIDNCEFRDCGIEDSGDGTNLSRNKFMVTKEWFLNKPIWFRVLLFIIMAIATALIARGVEKLWL